MTRLAPNEWANLASGKTNQASECKLAISQKRSGFRLPVALHEVLFVSQRDHGIDSRRPTRGKETR